MKFVGITVTPMHVYLSFCEVLLELEREYQAMTKTIYQTPITHPPGGATICNYFSHSYAHISVGIRKRASNI